MLNQKYMAKDFQRFPHIHRPSLYPSVISICSHISGYFF